MKMSVLLVVAVMLTVVCAGIVAVVSWQEKGTIKSAPAKHDVEPERAVAEVIDGDHPKATSKDIDAAPSNWSSRNERDQLEDVRRIAHFDEDQIYVDRAVELLGEKLNSIPVGISPQVTRSKESDLVQVSWMISKPESSAPSSPGPDFYYQVIFKGLDSSFEPLIIIGG